jgi:hypothetical protein
VRNRQRLGGGGGRRGTKEREHATEKPGVLFIGFHLCVVDAPHLLRTVTSTHQRQSVDGRNPPNNGHHHSYAPEVQHRGNNWDQPILLALVLAFNVLDDDILQVLERHIQHVSSSLPLSTTRARAPYLNVETVRGARTEFLDTALLPV